MTKVKNAIISVYDKTSLVEFASELAKMGVNIFSSGGSFKALAENGIKAVKVEDYTGFPEMMDGRVKTLHPKIHGGILACRDNEKHLQAAKDHDITMFDMVVVNLYPFKKTVESGKSMAEIIENIDIGGPTLVRSAAKNHKFVAVVTSPDDYARVLDEMKKNDGEISFETRFDLARKAFSHTALYDGYISSFFSTVSCSGEKIADAPELLTLQFKKKESLRYGENPHQTASVYVEHDAASGTTAAGRQLHGKQLSFNNYMDLDSAKNIVAAFDDPAVAIVKHTNPCGAAIGSTLAEAYTKALACDPVSAFGSIIAVNRTLDAESAELMSKLFVEAVCAPEFTPEALAILEKKKNIRLIELGKFADNSGDIELKKISGGLLFEGAERRMITAADFNVVTDAKPTPEQIEELVFAQNMVRFIKSNAILLTKNKATVGVGAGQMSRIDSLEIAIKKSQQPTAGCVMASDAFFPFRDCVDRAAEAGIAAIIQPGGSVRDQESIDACNEHGIPMIFTGIRSFKHL